MIQVIRFYNITAYGYAMSNHGYDPARPNIPIGGTISVAPEPKYDSNNPGNFGWFYYHDDGAEYRTTVVILILRQYYTHLVEFMLKIKMEIRYNVETTIYCLKEIRVIEVMMHLKQLTLIVFAI